MSEYRLLYILGSGHCGSTLLDLLLNGHPRILAVGEIGAAQRHLELLKPSPAAPGRARFWRGVSTCIEQKYGIALSELELSQPNRRETAKWGAERVQRWSDDNCRLFSCAAMAADVDVLTDSTKVPNRLELLHGSGRFDIRVLHLVRDGRAVVNSYMRKYGSFQLALRRWGSTSVWALRHRSKFARDSWLRVRYEDLALAPVNTLAEVCEFVGLSYDPAMLSYRRHPYLGLGGNRMRHGKESRIFLDERWKVEMTRQDRVKFKVFGGWLNRLYGY